MLHPLLLVGQPCIAYTFDQEAATMPLPTCHALLDCFSISSGSAHCTSHHRFALISGHWLITLTARCRTRKLTGQ
jgi:hypothetical protein